MLLELNKRSQAILKIVVESYMATGDPVGSRTISNLMGMRLSPATIRNAMADMEEAGLLFSQHISGGRLPTETGLKMFVDGLLEIGDLSQDEQESIRKQIGHTGQPMQEAMDKASRLISGLSHCAGLVAAPKKEKALKQVDFVHLAPGRVLVILVANDGSVENRMMETTRDITPSVLEQASNFLNHHLASKTLSEARQDILKDIEAQKTEVDSLTQSLIKQGLAIPSGATDTGVLIVRGQSHLLENVQQLEELEKLRQLFDALEKREILAGLLEQAGQSDGVQIFIGAQNTLFNHSGCSLIVSPYKDKSKQIIGAIGVIGPKRLNYARIIPMVDYTAKLLGQMVD
jgi:heat-inducible transcriptional repressor